MFIIDLILKNTPLTLSIQRKSSEDAETTYKQILDAIKSGSGQVLELSCDRQTDKRIAVLSSEISGVQISEKSGAGSGKTPGFFAIAE